MKNRDLHDLLGVENEICVSVIVPTHPLSPDRRTDRLQVERAVSKAKFLLDSTAPTEKSSGLKEKLDHLVNEIDFMHNANGIGLFVSASQAKLLRFPFEVNEKVTVNDYFELRELLYLENFSREYLLLDLNEKSVRLFKGITDELTEINDEHFPRIYEDDYEYARPVRGSSYTGNAFVKQFERDKSQLEEIRLKEFFHETDPLLDHYLSKNDLLVLAGTEKVIALYEATSKHSRITAGHLNGNNTYTSSATLGSLAWLKIWAYINEEKAELVKMFEEKLGEGLAVEGIKPVWEASRSGQGWKLIVEKDFSAKAFIDENDKNLYLEAPAEKYSLVPNVIDAIIVSVLQKKGAVTIVENGFLNNHQHIGLITRY